MPLWPGYPPRWRCVSLRPDGAACRNFVDGPQQRCTECWFALAMGTVPQALGLIAEANLPPAVAQVLAKHRSATVRAEMATACTDPDILSELVMDEEVSVAAAAIVNPATPLSALVPLRGTTNAYIRRALMTRQAT